MVKCTLVYFYRGEGVAVSDHTLICECAVASNEGFFCERKIDFGRKLKYYHATIGNSPYYLDIFSEILNNFLTALQKISKLS